MKLAQKFFFFFFLGKPWTFIKLEINYSVTKYISSIMN